MDCPICETRTERREGRFGPFLFCPQQNICKQRTLTIREHLVDLELEFKALRADAPDMARMAFENGRYHERNHDHGSVDPWDVVFGNGPLVDGPYEDDEDAILW